MDCLFSHDARPSWSKRSRPCWKGERDSMGDGQWHPGHTMLKKNSLYLMQDLEDSRPIQYYTFPCTVH